MDQVTRFLTRLGEARVAVACVPVSEAELASLQNEFADAPASYLDMMRRVGGGTIGESYLQFYTGLVGVSEIFEEGNDHRWRIFGDDFQGCCYGFDLRTWAVVAISGPEDADMEQKAESFGAFLDWWADLYTAM